ncbi:MAG: FIG00389673: hypothetical protein, partial [uncultured Nocardioidaceae bacterium]
APHLFCEGLPGPGGVVPAVEQPQDPLARAAQDLVGVREPPRQPRRLLAGPRLPARRGAGRAGLSRRWL